MHKFLSVFLGIMAFLAVCLYWLWQMLAGEPALPLEDVALRALGAMLAVWLLGRLLGRLGMAMFAEAWHESRARAADRTGRRMAFGGGRSPAAAKETGAKRPG
jgi:hypothetical protein